MGELITQLDELIFNKDGVPMTNSLKVANYFGKEHCHVLRDIENLLKSLQVVDTVGLPNFGETEREWENNLGFLVKDKVYNMTKDGFTLLAMGFTGEEALKFKIAYMNKFNEMEAFLRKSISGEVFLEANKDLIKMYVDTCFQTYIDNVMLDPLLNDNYKMQLYRALRGLPAVKHTPLPCPNSESLTNELLGIAEPPKVPHISRERQIVNEVFAEQEVVRQRIDEQAKILIVEYLTTSRPGLMTLLDKVPLSKICEFVSFDKSLKAEMKFFNHNVMPMEHLADLFEMTAPQFFKKLAPHTKLLIEANAYFRRISVTSEIAKEAKAVNYLLNKDVTNLVKDKGIKIIALKFKKFTLKSGII